MEVDMYGFKAAMRKWQKKYGDERITVEDGGWFLYPSGAMVSNNPFPVFRDPPANEFQRCRLIERFYQTKLDRAKQKFDELKRQILSNPEAYDDDEDHVSALKNIQDIVLALKKQRDEAQIQALKHSGGRPAPRSIHDVPAVGPLQIQW